MESIDRRLLYQQFQEAFPIEYLKEMPLDKYTNLNRADSFCYWLESETYKLGSIWGGSSYKFGIYKYNKRPNEADSRIQSDDNYAWYAKYNKGTAEEAYLLVRDAVVSIAEYARNGDLESIDEINTLGDTFKWKIAFLYSNESLIPIYNKDMLNIVSEELGMNDPKGKSIPFIQRFLMQKKGDTDLYVFYDSILSIWEAHKAPNTFKAVKEKVIEKLNADSRFRAYPGGKVYLWIGTADGHINNSDCHYELCADGNPKASHERGKVFVELHCEGKDVNQYKCLAEIDGVHSFPWKKFAIRANDEGWVISDYTTEELADILIDELYRLDDLVGEKVRSISDTEPSEKRYWLYAPGENASKWQECQDKGIICIGWDDLGDVSQYETIDEIQSKLQEVNQNPEGSFKNDRLALWDFCRVMKPGDIVYAKQGMSKIIGRGIVTGEYVFDDSRANYKSYRQVEWTHIGCWEASECSIPLKTLTDFSEFHDVWQKIEELFNSDSGRHYWWLVAKPKIWSLTDMKNNEVQEYTLYNDNGNRRRVFQNFLNAKAGDLVIGYEATPTKQIVALLEIAQGNDGKNIWFRKNESLGAPIDYSILKQVPELQQMEFFVNPNGSLFKMTEEEYNTVMDCIREDNPIASVVPIKKYTKEDFLKDVYVAESDFETLTSLLLRKKNIILQGAPGVGKTYAAKRLACAVMGEVDEERIEQVQFHQNYSYEDFMMGYKPNENGGFDMRTGVFYNFCKRAIADSDRPYFFIIDEINRGNLSKIFGELLMLIEQDYRDKPIKLSYRDEKFAVPRNLHIIGMMNTADRSLAMIDYALRRRFSFFEMKPGFDSVGFNNYLKSIGNDKLNKVVNAVVALNNTIADDASLGNGFCIGHSYFCNLNSKITDQELAEIVNYDIFPMLREYWFDNDNKYESEAQKLRNALK